MMYDLPTGVDVCGTQYEIRSDFRAALDLCAVLSDSGLSDIEKGYTVCDIFYPAFAEMPPEHYEEAVKRCFWFIGGGDAEQSRAAPKLMNWEQDFKYIVAPVNRVLGEEVRAVQYLHWWTFIAAYYEIGDCTFAQIMRIRTQLAKGKTLDKSDREWYRQNRHLVDLQTNYSDAEQQLLSQWMK